MLYATLHRFLQTQQSPDTRYVLALSGGMDSRVLLHLLARYQHAHPDVVCQAVHVHHGLSTHADTWAAQCVAWATAAGIDCVVERVTLPDGPRQSIEQLARDARYQALAKHVDANAVLLTAQHADDQLETFLLALKRGSGPAGLSAMPAMMAFAGGQHCRPLLDIPREAIEQYAHAHQLAWVEDESNQDTRYDRNFLRHQITPLLTERWPGIRKAVARSAALCGEQERLLEELLAAQLAQAVQPDGSLAIAALGSERQGKALIRLWLAKQALLMPSQAQLVEMWDSVVGAKADANPQLCWHQYTLRRFQQRLYVVQPHGAIDQVVLPCPLGRPCVLPTGLGTVSLQYISPAVFRVPDIASEVVPDTAPSALPRPFQATLRAPKQDEAVTVRFAVPAGLEVCPVGRAGKRKLKKLYQEYGVPSWQRRRLPLIFYGEQLVAVAGIFVVAAFAGDDCEIVWDIEAAAVQAGGKTGTL